MFETLKTQAYEHRRSEKFSGEEVLPETPVTDITLDASARPILHTKKEAYRFDGITFESVTPPSPPSRPELPPPWESYCEQGQGAQLAQIGDRTAIVWFHNELHIVGPNGFAEVMMKGYPPPLKRLHCGDIGSDGTLWLGGEQGAVCWRDGRWEYYGGPRYLPSDEIIDIAADEDGEAWIATTDGIVHITRSHLTLAQKAQLFEQQVRDRHCRHGYVTGCDLAAPGDLENYCHKASDNDGLWTALYVAAQCFRHAVTGNENAKQWAWQSTKALLDLERRTPIPGFPARACVKKGEDVHKSGGEWHLTETYHAPGESEAGPSPDGPWKYKGDTSSDELDGHYFAYSIYHDLVANEAQKQQIRQVVERMTDHLIENNFLLIDIDGERTRWGVFSPDYLNGSWEPERGLNSLSILSHLRVAHHICGHQRYLDAARELIDKHHYAINTINQKILPPGDVNHSDDELAFICYYPLLTYETDPALRKLYLMSLERSWRIERPERNPLWNFIYGAVTRNPCDIGGAVRTLAEIPLDMVNWPVQNSHRNDINVSPRTGRFGEIESCEPPRADERPVGKWKSNPYRLDGGGDGRCEEDATHYLLPYWMGRYHGLIE